MDQPTPLQLATDDELTSELLSRAEGYGGLILLRGKPTEGVKDGHQSACTIVGPYDELFTLYAMLTARLSLSGFFEEPEELRNAVAFWIVQFKEGKFEGGERIVDENGDDVEADSDEDDDEKESDR